MSKKNPRLVKLGDKMFDHLVNIKEKNGLRSLREAGEMTARIINNEKRKGRKFKIIRDLEF